MIFICIFFAICGKFYCFFWADCKELWQTVVTTKAFSKRHLEKNVMGTDIDISELHWMSYKVCSICLISPCRAESWGTGCCLRWYDDAYTWKYFFLLNYNKDWCSIFGPCKNHQTYVGHLRRTFCTTGRQTSILEAVARPKNQKW